MRVLILGGGPAGLYAALLLKKSQPGWEVRLTERNAPDATYGWGVVFSDRTLSGLHEADVRTSTQITDSFVLWEAIDVHFRDALVRCDGHAFAGIGRMKLLNILQARCVELGVDLHFETDVGDPMELRAGCDLLIAADGVNSRTRAMYADTFKPTTGEGQARFVWYGTDKPLDAFTFIFRDTEFGLFTVHSYPFDGTTSTFIVECHEETWRNAGLDQMDEAESMAFCQSLFADHLGQHRLMSNRSLWLSFTTLKCRRWVHENVVLLGDAAHTAHFSIGSGTKLALEDSIALAQAFDQHDDMRAALRTYEQARRPRVEATQRAAAESQRYFENVRRYRHYEPQQFAFHLLTRSGRITWDNLRGRDPYFVADVERWFQVSARLNEPETPLLVAPAPMFAPLQLRHLALLNRIVMSPATGSVAHGGLPNPGHAAQLERLAVGGAGLVLTEPVAVSAHGRVTPDDVGIYTEEQAQGWRQIVAKIHAEASAALGLTLAHAGRRGSTRPRAGGLDRPLREGNWPLFAPSAIPYGPASQLPAAMTCADLAQVREEYVNAATFAAASGFDLLQLDMAHGGLLASFLSPLTNQRADEYGGDLRHRLRYPLQILDAVRNVWPADSPLLVTIPATDWQRGGLRLPDAVEIASSLKQHGCDLVTVHAGQTTPDAQPRYDFETLAGYADIIRNESGIPTMSTAYMTTSNQANTLLAGGRCDLVLYLSLIHI